MQANTFNGGLVLKAGDQFILSDPGICSTIIQGYPAGMAWFMNDDGENGIIYSDQQDGDRIYRWDLGNRSRELLYDGPAYGLLLAWGKWLYFIDERTRHLCRLRADGRNAAGAAETVVDQPVLCYAIHEDRILYSTPARLEMCNPDGLRPAVLASVSAASLVVAGGLLVFTDRGREHILTVAEPDGRIRGQVEGARTLVLNTDGQYVYYCDHVSDFHVFRLEPATGSRIRVFGGPASWLHLIDDRLYFWHDRDWHVMSLTGGQARKVSE